MYVSGASRILQEMPFIVVSNVFQERLVFSRNALDRPECMLEVRLAFCGKCLLSPCLMCFKSVLLFAGNTFLIVLSSCLRSIWQFAGNAFYHRLQCLPRASGILLEMPFIVVRNLFQECLAFCEKCLVSSFLRCFISVCHFEITSLL